MKYTLALVALFLLVYVPPAHAADAAPSYVDLADGPTIAVDWSRGNAQAVTLHGNRAFTFANGQKGAKYLLVLTQDATGSRTVTWPSSVRWPGVLPQAGGKPAGILTTSANQTDYVAVFYNGVTYVVLALAQ